MKINWGKNGTTSMGVVTESQYNGQKCTVPNKGKEEHWFMLSDPSRTYLCTKGPFNSPEERDTGIIEEVRKA